MYLAGLMPLGGGRGLWTVTTRTPYTNSVCNKQVQSLFLSPPSLSPSPPLSLSLCVCVSAIRVYL